jgi:hypothetical protein
MKSSVITGASSGIATVRPRSSLITVTASWEKGAALVTGGEYAQTNYANPLGKFHRYAERLATNGYSPDTLGRFVRQVFEAKRPKTKHTIVPSRFADWTMPASLPERWLDRLVGRSLGLK